MARMSRADADARGIRDDDLIRLDETLLEEHEAGPDSPSLDAELKAELLRQRDVCLRRQLLITKKQHAEVRMRTHQVVQHGCVLLDPVDRAFGHQCPPDSSWNSSRFRIRTAGF